MVSGLALMIIILHIRKRVLGLQGEQEAADSRITGNLVTMMFIFLIIELFLMGSDLAVLAHSGKDEYEMFICSPRGLRPSIPGGGTDFGRVDSINPALDQANQASTLGAMRGLRPHPVRDPGDAYCHRNRRPNREVVLG